MKKLLNQLGIDYSFGYQDQLIIRVEHAAPVLMGLGGLAGASLALVIALCRAHYLFC